MVICLSLWLVMFFCLSINPSCLARTFTLSVCTRFSIQLQANSFIPAMRICTFDLNCSVLPSIALTLAEGHKLHFLTRFSAELDESWSGVEGLQAEYADTSSEWDFVVKGNKLLLYLKIMFECIWMFTNNVQTWYDDWYCWTLQFDISLVELDFDSMPQGYENSDSKYCFTSCLTEFSVRLWYVVDMFVWSTSYWSVCMGKKPYWGDSLKWSST